MGHTPNFQTESLTFLIEELPLNDVVVLLDVLVVAGLVEEDEEGQTLLRKLLGVLGKFRIHGFPYGTFSC